MTHLRTSVLLFASLGACQPKPPPVVAADPGPVAEDAKDAPVAPVLVTGVAYGELVKVGAPTEEGQLWRFMPAVPGAPSRSAAGIEWLTTVVAGFESDTAWATVVLSDLGAVTEWRCIGIDTGSCRPPDDDAVLVLHGTEPFWALEVYTDRAVYTEMDAPAPRTFSVSIGAGDGPWTLTPDAGGTAWTVRLTGLTCSDGMADVLYPSGVVVERGEEVLLQGCAFDLRP